MSRPRVPVCCLYACPAACCLLGALIGMFYCQSTDTTADINIQRVTGRKEVVIQSVATGAYLAVDRGDSAVKSSSKMMMAQSTRFTMLTVSPSTVARLRELAAAREADVAAARSHTRSGCQCSGFSSEHGFGRYCHPWESEWQDAWCYVNETCAGNTVRRGSFKRRHEMCTFAPPPSPPPLPNSPPPTPPSPPPPPSPVGGWQLAHEWGPPEGCKCSGFSNRHGFGAHCAAWESKHAPAQTPWCYVNAECPAVGRSGSFGRAYANCVAIGPRRSTTAALKGVGAPAAVNSPLLSRRLDEASASGPHRARRPNKRQKGAARLGGARVSALIREEQSLLRDLAGAEVRYVALISAVSSAYLAVEMPPHRLALQLHAKSDALSLANIFAQLPAGRLVALGTNAYLAVCEPLPPPNYAPWLMPGHEREGQGGVNLAHPPPKPAARPGAPAVCSGYKESRKELHYTLLRAHRGSNASQFRVRVVGARRRHREYS